MSECCLVTGAGGFIGSHLVEALLHRGKRVRALVRYNSRSSWGWLEEYKDGKRVDLEVMLGDVTDPHQMNACVDGCDTIYHLAALIGIPYSYTAPESYFATNVLGTLHLVQAARDCGVRRFVHTSTSEVYGTARVVPITEDHPLQGQSPYSASKIAADKLVESYFSSFDLPAVVVRPFNTYGPRQSSRAVIPTIISQALKGGDVRLGALDPVRDLTFVTDTAKGFIAAAESEGIEGAVINLGTGGGISIGDLATTIFRLLGVQQRIMTDAGRIRPRKSEVMRLISDNTRARELTGWIPEISLEEGLSRTIEWMRAHLSEYREEGYTV